MNSEDAKAILLAWRKGDLPEEFPPLREAFAMAESDPVLTAWLEEEAIFDAKISSAVESIPVPEGLRDQILNAAESAEAPAHKKKMAPLLRLHRLLPIAASLLVLFLVSFLFLDPLTVEAEPGLNDYCDFVIDSDETIFGSNMKSENFGELMQFLQSKNAPTPSHLPPLIIDLNLVGASATSWRGIAVSVYELEDVNNATIQLFITQVISFPNPDELPTKPAFRKIDEKSLVIWRDGQHLHALASKDGGQSLSHYIKQ